MSNKLIIAVALIAGLTLVAVMVWSGMQTKKSSSALPLPAAAPQMPPAGPERTTAETMTIVGTLVTDYSRKGTPLITNDKMTVFVNEDYFKTETGKQAKNWNNKKVEAKGIVVTKECGPTDQCLSDGYMRFLKEIAYIALIEQ